MYVNPHHLMSNPLTTNRTLSLLVLYIVFGTLYNRYVLHLRGIDQFPQFSIASMKYHAHEALDWMKDVAGGMREGGRSMGANSGLFPGGSFSRTDINPISHQNQAPVSGSSAEPAHGGFVRPPQ